MQGQRCHAQLLSPAEDHVIDEHVDVEPALQEGEQVRIHGRDAGPRGRHRTEPCKAGMKHWQC